MKKYIAMVAAMLVTATAMVQAADGPPPTKQRSPKTYIEVSLSPEKAAQLGKIVLTAIMDNGSKVGVVMYRNASQAAGDPLEIGPVLSLDVNGKDNHEVLATTFPLGIDTGEIVFDFGSCHFEGKAAEVALVQALISEKLPEFARQLGLMTPPATSSEKQKG